MAETSGFFSAEYDEQTGTYDRAYLAEQFAAYFALFINNGVFANPTNQLQVVASASSSKVILKEGWAFIKGQWYHNDSDKELSFAGNYTTANRIDCVKVRVDYVNRSILGLYFEGTTEVLRTDDYFDLKLAEVTVPPNVSFITDANITDTRSNEDVCGFVTGLIELTPTKELFARYDALFQAWFEDVQNQLSDDVAANLQKQIGSLALLETTSKASLVAAINEVRLNPLFAALEIPASADLDEYTTEGFYFCQAAGVWNSNNSNQFALMVVKSGDAVSQIQYALDNGTVNVRTYIETWQSWQKQLTTGDIVNNFTSTAIDKALSADCGRRLHGSIEALTLKLASYQNIVYSATEPETIEANTIVFVYEE